MAKKKNPQVDRGMTPLRKARRIKGDTLLEVAAAVGSDVGNLSRIERAAQRCNTPLAERLARYFGTVSEIEILYPERYMKGARA